MYSFLTSNRDGPSTSAATGTSTSKSRRDHPYAKHDRTEIKLAPKTTFGSNKLNNQSNKVIDEGKQLIVGSVEQVTRWCQMLSSLEPTKIIYQVFGIMGLIKTGSNKCEKVFCLHSEHKKSGIVCVFYEIDRKIPIIQEGTLVLCTGHVKGKNKLQIFTIRELDENDKNSFDRISLVIFLLKAKTQIN